MHRTYSIPKPWDTRYKIARFMLVLAFLLAGAYFVFLILFPSQSLVFDFKNPGASKNTLLDPHAPDGTSLEKGNVAKNTPFIVDAALVRGDYSLLDIALTPDKKSQTPGGSATIQKSYRAFFLPEGSPITEKADDGNGFHSGSLLSFADGVFLIDGNLVRPIGDATIFENLGYHWEDVVPASEEDMGVYEKGKMVILGNRHPDGTVFYDTDTRTYFLIRNEEKHAITDESIAQSYLHGTHPILASKQALDIEQSCPLRLNGWLAKQYVCSTPIDILKNLPGDSYKITLRFDANASFQDMETTFAETVNIANMRTSLSQIKQRIFSHYGYGQ